MDYKTHSEKTMYTALVACVLYDCNHLELNYFNTHNNMCVYIYSVTVKTLLSSYSYDLEPSKQVVTAGRNLM